MARHPWLLVLPCDAPRIDRALLETLLQAAGRTPARPWMLRCGGQWEPLFSLIPTHLAEEIEHAWRQGDRSPRHVLLPLGAEAIELAAGDPRLANLNTPEPVSYTHLDVYKRQAPVRAGPVPPRLPGR